MILRWSWFAVAWPLLLGAWAAGSYQVIDLGKLTYPAVADVADINNAGQVIYNDLNDGDFESGEFGVVIEPDGRRRRIDPPEGFLLTQLRSINDRGEIIANFDIPEGREDLHSTPYLIDASGHASPLPPAPGGAAVEVNRINNLGQITGRTGIRQDSQLDVFSRAFRLDTASGKYVELKVPGDGQSHGQGINNHGVVVGFANFPGGVGDFPIHAFRSDEAGNETDLGTLHGGAYSEAFAINDAGQIAAQADDGPAGRVHAVRFEPDGTITDIGVLPGFYMNPADINASGQIVGTSQTGDVETNMPWL